ncbi:MAG: hypothetical protein ABW178_01490 [Pseudoxanthomonas sp.]
MELQSTPPDVLRTGDVLVMLGHGPLSALIAWCSDSVYSHSAIVADNGDLIEAAGSGVRRYAIADRLKDDKNFHFIDGFRTLSRGGLPLDDADRAAILAHAESLLGTPYPLNSLAMLGVIVAVRGKLPQHPLARLLVREALDYVVKDNPSHMMCSELVYRALAECDVQPVGRLAPVIVITPPTHLPFPDINWIALWEEVGPLLLPQSKLKATLAAANDGARGAASTSIPTAENIPDEELLQRIGQARAALGLEVPTAASEENMVGPVGATLSLDDLRPNPKLVTPQDLASTPDHMPLGRFMQAVVATA